VRYVVAHLDYRLADAWALTPRELWDCLEAIYLRQQFTGAMTLATMNGPRLQHPVRSVAELIGEPVFAREPSAQAVADDAAYEARVQAYLARKWPERYGGAVSGE
jgi:hypothetical protein